jgi:hypothetical protein
LGRIVVAQDIEGSPVTADDLVSLSFVWNLFYDMLIIYFHVFVKLGENE